MSGNYGISLFVCGGHETGDAIDDKASWKSNVN